MSFLAWLKRSSGRIAVRINIISFLSLIITGCSSIGHTFASSSEDEKNLIYIGTRASAYNLTHKLEGGRSEGWEFLLTPVVYLIGAIDLPFTMVFDTILLPYTIPVSVKRNDDSDMSTKP